MKKALLLALLTFATLSLTAAEKTIVLVAGTPSHGPGDHEFNAGTLLLKKCLEGIPGVKTRAHLNGWPADEEAFEGADAIFLYMDGGAGHPILKGDRLQKMGELMKKGVGLGCAHFAVEIPKGRGGNEFSEWIGGFYEDGFSTNPHWTAEIQKLPEHPITRGVKPFKVLDEWYFNIRFREEKKKLTPILIAKPDDEARQGKSSWPRGPHPHIVAASGRDEVLMWAVERPDGGRGFGFTGGHKHINWGNDDYRKLVLNALLWIARAEVPANGVQSTVTPDELKQNLDPKTKR